jgi:hypothetical protein
MISGLRPFDIEECTGRRVILTGGYSRRTMQRTYRTEPAGWRKVSGVMAADAREALSLFDGDRRKTYRAVPWRSKECRS